jgi:hypothetical protein
MSGIFFYFLTELPVYPQGVYKLISCLLKKNTAEVYDKIFNPLEPNGL